MNTRNMNNLTIFNEIEIPYNNTKLKLINDGKQIQFIVHNNQEYNAEKIEIYDSDTLDKKASLDISPFIDKLILNKMIFNNDSQYVFIEQSYGKLYILKKTVDSFKFISEFEHPKIESVSCLIINKDQTLLIMSNYNREILVFRLYINNQIDEINITYIKHYNLQVMTNVYDLVLSPDESKLLVYGIKTYFNDDDFESNVIEIFDICTDSFIFLINGINYMNTPIIYHNNPSSYAFLNNDTLIVPCDSNYIQIWNINESEIEDTLYSSYKICSITIMNNSPNVFIAGTTDCNIIIFDLNRSQYITKIYNHLMIPIINPDPDIFRGIYIRNILIDKNDELIYVTFPGNIYTSPHKLKILSTNKYKKKQLFTFLIILYRLTHTWFPYELCDLIFKFF